MDKYKIDSHKLIYHVPRVKEWMDGKVIYPLYMEVSPTGVCNHRCTYCALDFMEYQNRKLDTDIFKTRLMEMGKLGLKSIMYAGEGEPFLHEDIADIINNTKKTGIDVGITTNAVLLDHSLASAILESVEWIKVSINGATEETYAKIHRCNKNDFGKVIKNLSHAVELRAGAESRCTLGMQLLLLPDNQHEAVPLARLAREIGMDYLVIKPYSQHPQSITDQYKDVKYENFQTLADELKEVNSDSFKVIFRESTMQSWNVGKKSYKNCMALPFWSYIDAGGNIWGCSMFMGDERFLYGNIHEKSFKEVWEGEQRIQSLRWVEQEMNTKQCRINCRMDKVNHYLWELKNPPVHVNFI